MKNLLASPRAVAGLDFDKDVESESLLDYGHDGYHLHLVEQGASRRAEAERFIADAYHRVFGAELSNYYPSIVALHDRQHALLGAVGARSAADQALFVENYLPRRIENVMAEYVGPVCRDHVVEIGNLAIARPWQSYLFLAMLGEWLQGCGVQWMVFSLTRPLRSMLRRGGVPLVSMAQARVELAPVDGNLWGSYYEFQPLVTAVPVREGLERFRTAFSRLNRVESKRKGNVG